MKELDIKGIAATQSLDTSQYCDADHWGSSTKDFRYLSLNQKSAILRFYHLMTDCRVALDTD